MKSRHGHPPAHGGWDMWRWPLALGLLTSVGLVSALFSEGGFGDALAWLTLGIPVAVGIWYGWGRR